MIPIPAIDLKRGRVVQLVGGDPGKVKVELAEDPVSVALDWVSRGSKLLHVVDLDRALGDGNNLRVIQKILEALAATGVRAQVGGGLRFHEDLDEIFNAGAAACIVGTRAVTDEVFLEQAAKRYGKRLLVAADARDDEIVVKGWTEASGKSLLEFAQRAAGLGLGGILYTDVGREGRMGGPNVEAVRRLAEAVGTRVIASGGVGSLEDLKALEAAGAWGTVVGMAFYTNRVRFEDAVEGLSGEG